MALEDVKTLLDLSKEIGITYLFKIYYFLINKLFQVVIVVLQLFYVKTKDENVLFIFSKLSLNSWEEVVVKPLQQAILVNYLVALGCVVILHFLIFFIIFSMRFVFFTKVWKQRYLESLRARFIVPQTPEEINKGYKHICNQLRKTRSKELVAISIGELCLMFFVINSYGSFHVNKTYFIVGLVGCLLVSFFQYVVFSFPMIELEKSYREKYISS